MAPTISSPDPPSAKETSKALGIINLITIASPIAPPAKKKKMFLAMLDLNQMYIQKTEMADKRFGIDKKDQKLTSEFYGGNN